MNENLEEALNTYLRFMQEEEYFEAHEALEEGWHPLRLRDEPIANLAKGLINGAICFEHIKRNKKNAEKKAQTVLASYERHKHLCKEGIAHEALFILAIEKIESLKLDYPYLLKT